MVWKLCVYVCILLYLHTQIITNLLAYIPLSQIEVPSYIRFLHNFSHIFFVVVSFFIGIIQIIPYCVRKMIDFHCIFLHITQKWHFLPRSSISFSWFCVDCDPSCFFVVGKGHWRTSCALQTNDRNVLHKFKFFLFLPEEV